MMKRKMEILVTKPTVILCENQNTVPLEAKLTASSSGILA